MLKLNFENTVPPSAPGQQQKGVTNKNISDEFTEQTNLNVIGYYPTLKKQIQSYSFKLEFHPNTKSYVPKGARIQKCKIDPVLAFSEGSVIGFIDSNKNAWVIGEPFQNPINLSLLIKKKVKNLALNQKQVILECVNDSFVLINWGEKKLLSSEDLIKLPVFDSKSIYENFFEAYSILECSKSNQRFYISNIKKMENTNKMYRITNEGYKIIGYPTLQKFRFKSKVLGISCGKFHSLCWDEDGSLYSWGCRSIALGFDGLPDEDFVTHPTKLMKTVSFKVREAYASTHYSLAISTVGNLYEWGIKREVNEMNDELIFTPREFSFKYFKNQGKKYTSLKGKNQKFGVICSSGDLYVWGEKVKKFIDPSASLPKQWQNGRIFEPYLLRDPSKSTNRKNEKVIDFSIEENYIVVIYAPAQSCYAIRANSHYWQSMVNTVREKFDLKKYRRNTEAGTHQTQICSKPQNMFQNLINTRAPNCQMRKSQQKINVKQTLTQLEKESLTLRFNDHISKVYNAKKSKEKYIQSVRDSDSVLLEILKPKGNGSRAFLQQLALSKNSTNTESKMLSVSASRKNIQRVHTEQSCVRSNSKQIFSDKYDLPEFLKTSDEEELERKQKKKKMLQKMNFTTTNCNVFRNSQSSQQKKKSYNLKLQQVLEKKRQKQVQTFNLTLRRLQENSIEFRMKRHREIQLEKQKHRHHQILKESLFRYLIKQYVIKTVSKPLALGRQVKISNFARKLKMQRLEKNIRQVFIKAKVKFGLKKLRALNISRFTILMVEWKKYVARFRERKYLEKRRFVVEELTKNFMKDKLKMGLSTSNLNIRKIQKLRQWLVLVKSERMKCLKQLWKLQLFSVMKISPESENSVVCHIPKNSDEITFETIYSERVQQNPNLILQNFLNKSPVFKIKVEYFRTVIDLFTERKKPLHKSEKIINYLSKSKKTRIKFMDCDDEDILLYGQSKDCQSMTQSGSQFTKINILSNDIYPYSLHFNLFTKMKNYDISIPEIMKKNQKWVKEEKNILEKCLQNVIRAHEAKFVLANRQFDLELANFIKNKYDVFCEKRWKYIIEYNQIEKSYTKKKKERELLRVMDLIGMRRLLEEDCIPEKHAILDEALKRKDAPQRPSPFIRFGNSEFREAFKQYYDQVYHRVKHIRKMQS